MLTNVPDSENYKMFWEHQMDQLYSCHKKYTNGKTFLYMHAEAMDTLLQDLYQKAIMGFEKKFKIDSFPISLIALGGYGRKELFPHSTVDIMVLYSEKIQQEVFYYFTDIFTEQVIYPLWDLRINVRKKFVPLENTNESLIRGFQAINAQLDARYISGCKNLFDLFQEEYEASFFRNEYIIPIVNQIFEEKFKRHKNFNTPFLLEPDIKFGLGGLRDYQTILWTGRAKYKTMTLQAIYNEGLLTTDQVEKLFQAHNFLIRVLSELHFQSQSCVNLLNCELQPSIAWELGYSIEDPALRVKTFMKDYYNHTHNIYNVVELFQLNLLKTLSKQKLVKASKLQRNNKKEFDGFLLFENNLTYNSKEIFKKDPVRLIRIFKYLQQYKAQPTLELETLIKDSKNLINQDIINDTGFNKCLCALFQAVGEVSSILKLMHKLEILEVLIPEFQGIKYLSYNDYYHQYTIDYHTLNSINLMDEIFINKELHSKHYYNAIKNTSKPWLIYLILLLHNLGKAKGSEFSKENVVLAKKVLDRFPIEDKEKEYILFVIEHQSLMKEFWQNHDIDDSQVLQQFIISIQHKELINYMYVTTYCDLKSISFYLWNSHKEELHTRFFENIKLYLTNHEDQHLVEPLYPKNYFSINDPKEIELHFRLLQQFDSDRDSHLKYNESLFPIIHWEGDINQRFTTVTIITCNNINLLKKLTATFYFAGYNIVHAKIFMRTDGITIHTFSIIDAKNNFHSQEHSKRLFLKNFKENPDKSLKKSHLDIIKNTYLFDDEKLSTNNLPSTVININQEEVTKQIVLELHCHYQLASLYKIALVIEEQGFDIQFAHIATEHKTIINNFLLEKNDDTFSSSFELLTLRERLNQELKTI